jgi:transposase-like protein
LPARHPAIHRDRSALHGSVPRRHLRSLGWRRRADCPRCGDRDRLGKLNGETIRLGTYKCYACRKIFSITHGTLFASSHVPLHKWLQAIYLTDGGTAPIRPHHLGKILNVSFRTSSAMLQRLHRHVESARPAAATAAAVRPTRRGSQDAGRPISRSYSASGTP